MGGGRLNRNRMLKGEGNIVLQSFKWRREGGGGMQRSQVQFQYRLFLLFPRGGGGMSGRMNRGFLRDTIQLLEEKLYHSGWFLRSAYLYCLLLVYRTRKHLGRLHKPWPAKASEVSQPALPRLISSAAVRRASPPGEKNFYTSQMIQIPPQFLPPPPLAHPSIHTTL